MKVGLTGGIASGKNFIAGLFAEKGCYSLDADDVSRTVTAKGGLAYEAVIDAFGKGVLTPDGDIDRKKLREIVVEDKEKLKLLESIVHPAIAKYADKWSGEIKGRDDKAIIIYHAPLLLEAGGADKHDAIVVIWCSEKTQLARLKARGYPPYEDAVKLMKSQMPYEEKLKYADFVIDNNGSEEDARGEVDRVYNLLKIFNYADKHK